MNDLFEPVPEILSWEIEDEHTRKELASYSEALNKLVAIGTHLLNWELQDVSYLEDERMVVASFFKRLLELLDSIALQVKVGAVSTAIIQLRVLFEISVQFEYLIEKDTKNRCYGVIITDKYRQFEKLKVEKLTDNQKEEKDRLLTLINDPIFKHVKNKYDNIRNKKCKGEIKWYNLFESNLSDFSKLVNEKYPNYKIYYQGINKGFGNDAVHSTDLFRMSVTMANESPVIIQMRNPTEAIGVAGIAFKIGKEVFERFVKRRSPAENSIYISAIIVCEKTHSDVAFSGLYNYKRR